MNILLSYSTAHFDPSKKPLEHQYWGSSASILARTLYHLLKKFGTVTYIDANTYREPQGRSKQYDLFVGIEANFAQILRDHKIEKSILFAVNMHPVDRNTILRSFALSTKFSFFNVARWLLRTRHIAPLREAIKKADAIMCVGNVATYNSYLKHGVSPQKIKVFNYGLDDTPVLATARQAIHRTRRLVYVASEIGLRKGFDILADCLQDSSIQHESFHIDVIGSPADDTYATELAALQQVLGDKMTYHGWVDSNSDHYQRLLETADYLLYPALEEGQAGTVLDTMIRGIVPIMSRHSGLDFSPLGTFELKLRSLHNRQLIKNALHIPHLELQTLKQRTLDYYREYHQEYKATFKQALTNFIETGTLYPHVSVILPIFNKQTTIKSLIGYLDRACRTYGKVDLDVIFDGCKDKTEKIVRAYFAQNHTYPVRFSVTPNIFEVKSNNLGLKRAKGEYAVIIQDDNFVYDAYFLFEAVIFLDKNPKAAILGGLAGVNYYPLGTSIKGPGQISMNKREVYWRQDEKTNPALQSRIFQVDAAMRGPLIFRTSFLKKYGYLDEAYVPLHQDDMDICFRAHSKGFKVYAMLMEVDNKALTQAHYDTKMNKFFSDTIERNLHTFYRRWTPSTTKEYTWINRTPIWRSRRQIASTALSRARTATFINAHIMRKVAVRRAKNIPQKLRDIKQALGQK